MPVNSNKPGKWKKDISLSVDFYNKWFINFAPRTFVQTRETVSKQVLEAFELTDYLRDISPQVLRRNPSVLPILRSATSPPIARDRLIGLARVPQNLVLSMEDKDDPRIPPTMNLKLRDAYLERIGATIVQLLDRYLVPWLWDKKEFQEKIIERSSLIIADRLTGAVSDPIIRNEQEKRQLSAVGGWLEHKGYTFIPSGTGLRFDSMDPGTFGFRVIIPINLKSGKKVNVPVDVAIKPKSWSKREMPLLIEAKSAGDFTNTNKRRKEEGKKIEQLRATYGKKIQYFLFLCGYFDAGYLGYEAAEGIDWVWEHNIDEMKALGL